MTLQEIVRVCEKSLPGVSVVKYCSIPAVLYLIVQNHNHVLIVNFSSVMHIQFVCERETRFDR